MEKIIVLFLFCIGLQGCGSVAPMEQIKNAEWVTYNHKTQYAVKDRSKSSIYLTVKYSSYTFLDKSTEMEPTAKIIFDKIAYKLAKERSFSDIAFDSNDFYVSQGYNGVTGISTTLVSNEVRLFSKEALSNDEVSSPSEATTLSRKLKELQTALEQGLITESEYLAARQKILETGI